MRRVVPGAGDLRCPVERVQPTVVRHVRGGHRSLVHLLELDPSGQRVEAPSQGEENRGMALDVRGVVEVSGSEGGHARAGVRVQGQRPPNGVGGYRRILCEDLGSRPRFADPQTGDDLRLFGIPRVSRPSSQSPCYALDVFMDGRDPRWGIRIDTPLTHPSLEDARAWMEGERKACVRRREHRVKRVGVAPTFS